MFTRDMAENNRFLGHTGSNGSSFGQIAAYVGYSGAGGENAAANGLLKVFVSSAQFLHTIFQGLNLEFPFPLNH